MAYIYFKSLSYFDPRKSTINCHSILLINNIQCNYFERYYIIFVLFQDNTALKVKNGKLVQANAKLQNEKAQLELQVTQLHEDFFKLNSSHAVGNIKLEQFINLNIFY